MVIIDGVGGGGGGNKAVLVCRCVDREVVELWSCGGRWKGTRYL